MGGAAGHDNQPHGEAKSPGQLLRVGLKKVQAAVRLGLVLPPTGEVAQQPLLGSGDHDFLPHVKKASKTGLLGAEAHGPRFDSEYTTKELLERDESKKQLKELQSIGHFHSFMTEHDWRSLNAVPPVKNQGACGSCWAFSVTGNVEGQQAIKNGELLSLSEQELVDCDKRDNGCNGGLPENAYKTLMELGGLELESEYGYDGKDEACQYNRSKVAVRVTGGVEISQNETQMAQWLFKNGPISVGLNANAMQFYKGGVSHPWKFLCSSDGIDHGVLIVGFGEHE